MMKNAQTDGKLHFLQKDLGYYEVGGGEEIENKSFISVIVSGLFFASSDHYAESTGPDYDDYVELTEDFEETSDELEYSGGQWQLAGRKRDMEDAVAYKRAAL